MRHQLKPSTPSAAARLRYITREGRYAVGLDGPRDDLRATGSGNLPSWAGGDAAVFWAAADGYERANARRCLELELNLPRELTPAQQIAVVEDYLARLPLEAARMPYTWAIHDDGDGNPHVHLMIQERPLDGHERTAETWFKRANKEKAEKGGAIKSTWWHDRQHVFWSRALWADACNQALIASGHAARFDARSKTVRFDEALERGQWLDAVLLSTITERHEGVAVAGMRRRLERDECWLEDLPDYAQRLIAYNDDARAHNCALRDWARTATEAELLAYLAPELEHRNPSAHVACWMAVQHAQALDEDRQRAVASAQQAGELELLSAVQIEQAERGAIAAELGELIALEQGDQLDDLLAIEVEQAHGAALVEDSARTAAQRAAELAAFVATERTAQQRNLLTIERAQAEARQRAAEEQARAQREAEARRQAERIAQAQQRAIQEREQAEAQRRQIIDQAREEHRAGDRMVRHARTVLERAQGDYQRAQEALAGLPQLAQERAQAVQQANAHAAEARRLTGQADAWLAAHRVRALAGMTAPADELREQAERHKQGYRNWAERARSLQSQAEGRESGARIFAYSLEQARRELAEAERHADRRWREQGGEYAAERRAELASQPDQGNRGGMGRAGFLEALQRVQERTQEPDQDQQHDHDWDGPSL
ncbi:MobA/MobL family protein [Geopseudomonas aromaticivorans]